MSNEGKFTEKQLRELGFNPSASGPWCKDDLSSDAPKSSTAHSEQNECGRSLAKEEHQGLREEGLRFRLIIHSYRTTLIDEGNASMKQIEDCLTLPQGRKKYGIGVFPDDSPQFCDQPLFLQTKVKKGLERTEIEVLAYNLEGEPS